MARFEIQTPQGRFEVEAPDMDAAMRALSGQPAESEAAKSFREQASAMTRNPKIDTPKRTYNDGAFRASSEGLRAGVFGGYDDEIGAGMVSPFDAGIEWLKGNGFDIGRSYTRIQKQLDEEKAARREAHPVASTVGEVAGGLALGGKAAQKGITFMGKGLPALPAAIAEGGAYGALYGSGEAEPGKRLEGAGWGGLTGAATGALVHGAGSAFNRVLARRAGKALPPPVGGDDMASEANALYAAMRESGVTVKPAVASRLKTNMDIGLKGTNDTLAPKAFGLKKLAADTLGDAPGIEELHNFSKSVNRVLRKGGLDAEDEHFVRLIKDQVQGAIDNIKASDLTGGAKAVEMWKRADMLWARQKKMETIDAILDMADVDGKGKYTQSGFANAIRKEMKTLYKSIKKGRTKGYTPDEIALVRQMASGGSNVAVINWFAKFAPRGVVSALVGPALGGAIGGPAGAVATPIMGHLAGKAADRGAQQAATALKDAIARGSVPTRPVLPNKAHPFIGGVTAGTTGLVRQR